QIGLGIEQDMQHPERDYPVQEARSQEPGIQIIGELVGALNKVGYPMASEMAERAIERYSKCEIDSVYLVYNEFKSVIAQRLVVEQVLPIGQIGEVQVLQAEEMGLKQKERAIEAAKDAGVRLRPADTREIDAEAAKF